jgi:copper chaperone
MLREFEVDNIKCEGCATTVKNGLRAQFGEVEVDLSCTPRIVRVSVEEEADVEALRSTLRKMGYPLTSDELGMLEHASAKAKSFFSCAVGKIENSRS